MRLKFVDNTANEAPITLETLVTGEVFAIAMRKDELYIRAKYARERANLFAGTAACVNLHTGIIVELPLDTVIVPVKATITFSRLANKEIEK